MVDFVCWVLTVKRVVGFKGKQERDIYIFDSFMNV